MKLIVNLISFSKPTKSSFLQSLLALMLVHHYSRAWHSVTQGNKISIRPLFGGMIGVAKPPIMGPMINEPYF